MKKSLLFSCVSKNCKNVFVDGAKQNFTFMLAVKSIAQDTIKKKRKKKEKKFIMGKSIASDVFLSPVITLSLAMSFFVLSILLLV